jgi:hypothetical protein
MYFCTSGLFQNFREVNSYPGTPELRRGQEGQPPPLPFTRRGKGGEGALSIYRIALAK